MPAPARAAGVLGLLGALPLGFMAVIALAFSTDSGTVPAAFALLLLVPLLPAVGSILLLCRRAWPFFLVSCVPGVLVFGWLLWSAGGDVTAFLGAQAAVALPAVALVCGLVPSVRRWVARRTP